MPSFWYLTTTAVLQGLGEAAAASLEVCMEASMVIVWVPPAVKERGH